MTYFARLKSLREILLLSNFTKRLMIDAHTDTELFETAEKTLKFLNNNCNHWVRLESENNGYIFSKETGSFLIVHDEWFHEMFEVSDNQRVLPQKEEA